MILGPLQCAALLVVMVLYPDHTEAVTCPVEGALSYQWTLENADGTERLFVDGTDEPRWTIPEHLSEHLQVRVKVAPVTGLLENDVPPSRSFVLRPCEGDFNYDGVVGVPDYLAVARQFGRTCAR